MSRVLRSYACFILAIAFLCTAIFPVMFLYGCSLVIQQMLNSKGRAKIERFWDAIGTPYEYLLKQSV
jgi:hypothetical protein